jgi:hypothetical protein
MRLHRNNRLNVFYGLMLAFASGAITRAGTSQIQFNRDIRPILSENCFACHGPDKNQRKAKLRLDVREVALEKEAIVPGKPDQSKLVEHIYTTNEDDLMPPPKTHKSLTAAQKALLKNWIAAGAEYEPHWAYILPQRRDPPQTKNSKWVRNPIDAFVLASLESKNIRPSPEADKRTLLRRLSLDLIGLPPTPEEVKAFLADDSSSAYEKQVDRLLASPHFGERMAVPWLDVVRFSDTVGYHGDQNQDIFPYRDYVIDSFNRNKPFDQFTIEQLAGDLLPNASVEARIATGFNRLNMMTREGGAQPKEYMAKYAADRVRTVSMAWLGSTMGCAECHDHKYDPFLTKDFYQMEAFFADLRQWGVYMDYGYTPNPDLRGFSNDHPFPPEIEVESPYLHRRIANLESQISDVTGKAITKLISDPHKKSAYEDWRKESNEFLKTWPDGWATPKPEVTLRMKDTNVLASTNFTIQSDATVSFSAQPKDGLKLTLPLSNMWVSAIRLEIVPQPEASTMAKGSRRKKGSGANIAMSATLKSKADAKPARLIFFDAEADHKQERYSNGHSIIGVKDMWQISTEDEHQFGVWLLEKPVQVKDGASLTVDLGNLAVASARVSVSPFSSDDPLKAGSGEALQKALKNKTPTASADRDMANRTYLLSAQPDANAVAVIRKITPGIRECRNGRAYTMVSVAQNPNVTRVLPRGNWQDESNEPLQPGVPHFLTQIPNPDGRRLTRLDLARWLVAPENPLTARAVVNRLWKQFFGTGISVVVDDLGVQGEWPVHPELLDWLACEFQSPKLKSQDPAHAWDIKHIVKLMVMSSTYREQSSQRPELKDVDPNNRLLACQSPRRLEAEFVRDNALTIAGLLNEEMGGPSTFPYQPAGYYVNLQFPDRDYHANTDERQYRRGVYAHWQRTFLQPMLANFDAPAREECIAARNVSNTPQQALTLLNDPTIVESSRMFAARVLGTPANSDADRLDRAFQIAEARPIKANEKQSLLNFLAAQREYYSKNADDATKLLRVGNATEPKAASVEEMAAWTQVCRVILNLQETITKY